MMNVNEYRYFKQPSVACFIRNMIAVLIWGDVALVITIIAATMRSGW